MAANNRISEVVIRRLPLYYRHLESLEKSGVTRISSAELGEQIGLTASQIRQDINFFGAFGQQGYGYNVRELKTHLAGILGLDRGYHMIVVGVGNIGRAILNYQSFYDRGFRIQALFDANPALHGTRLRGIPVAPADTLEAYLSKHAVDIGVICTPREFAQQTADILVAGGVRAIWNFAPVQISVPPQIPINHVHLTDSLLVLSYKLAHSEQAALPLEEDF